MKKEAIYSQIYQQIKQAIYSGSLCKNTKLLSKRKMAQQLGVSVNTVDTAYAQLVSEGFLKAIPKKGFFVCEIENILLPKQKDKKEMIQKTKKNEETFDIDFSMDGVDEENFPFSIWNKLTRNVLYETTNYLRCCPPEGEKGLRDAICSYLALSRGVQCLREQIVIGAGTDNLLQILSYILEDCNIAMENPVYHEAYHFFRKMGHEVIPIPLDNQGIEMKHLEKLSHTAVYVTPSHQFPLGITTPISRRLQLLNWANTKENCYIIEDDYDSEFRFDGKPVPSLKSIDENEKVIYLGSFSRSIAPSLRISYMVLPDKLLPIFQEQFLFRCAVSKLDQLILEQFLKRGHYETHLNKMRKRYREKRSFFINQLSYTFGEKIKIYGENAGQYLLLGVYLEWTEEQLCILAAKQGVKVYPISIYFMNNVPQQYEKMVIVGYGPLREWEIEKGVALLKKAWIF